MKIGEVFEKSGLIGPDTLKKALEEQKENHLRLGDIVLKMGAVTTEQMAPVLAQYFNLPYIKLKEMYKDIRPETIDTLPVELAHRFTVIPVEIKNNVLILATFDPLNLIAIDTLRNKTNNKIQCVVAAKDDIVEAIDYCYNFMPRMNKHIEQFTDEELGEEVPEKNAKKLLIESSYQPVIQYVMSLITQAVNSRASDIHLQPKEETAELRLRIDGVLYHIEPPPKTMLAAITTRIKVLSGLDIAQRRLPQEGRFKINICDTHIDIRSSFFPTIYGESIVLRLLNASSPLAGLDQLGFSPQDLNKYRQLIRQPYGMILITGPTGSGKTTTLYTSLNEIKKNDKKIVTLEDPVEYRLPFIQQTQVNPIIGFNFARGLRSILRQDPDIIMVGEIRDKETAEITIHAALTGHLVFSTLHTNDATSATVRLINMGVEPFLITSSLLGVVAQRLIRKICPVCRETYKLIPDLLEKLNLNSGITELHRGKGCPQCLKSGYQGREGIFELFMLDEYTRKLILERRSAGEIRAAAQNKGMRTLRETAMQKLKAGLTTHEELVRITQEIEET